jgi:hypothetical protein
MQEVFYLFENRGKGERRARRGKRDRIFSKNPVSF